MERWSSGTWNPQGGLCSAEHNEPYEQRWVMRSVGRYGLVTPDFGVQTAHNADPLIWRSGMEPACVIGGQLS